MMTKEQFNNIDAGDFLIFNSGVDRKVISRNDFSLTFNKIKGVGDVYYLYHDICKKVIGVYRIKPIKINEL